MSKKQTMMPLPTGGGTGRRAVVVLVALAVLALIIRDPAGAAVIARLLATWGGAVLDGLVAFFQALS
ncbi:hypothetical protein JNUCC0626_36585 [Lentzea sp. JNUCC 0626]|uniref:hypothetical protein n=1 Tax=Lentzea sp. JNUCC 0626 TaxID=3367513 RepID=UPI00374954E4